MQGLNLCIYLESAIHVVTVNSLYSYLFRSIRLKRTSIKCASVPELFQWLDNLPDVRAASRSVQNTQAPE